MVYLRASEHELYRRLERDKTRPLLQTANPKQRLKELLLHREPMYEKVADVVFETGAGPIQIAVKQLINVLEQQEVI